MVKWNNRKISYVGVLIASSVVFVLIGSMMFAVTTFPSIKISFAGITVKITGFMFGPVIGFITGFLADIISFIYLPTYYHIGYSFSLALMGFVPGVVMWIFSRRKYSVNTYFFATLMVLFVIMVGFSLGVFFIPHDLLESEKVFIHNRIVYEIITIIGFAILMVLTFIFRFRLTEKNFKGMAQIVIFTAILGVLNPLLVALWDSSSIGIPYATGLVVRLITTTPEMLFNIVIIFVAWRIIQPQISKNFNNAYA